MDKNSFTVSKDASGQRYVFQTNRECDKNQGIKDCSFETTGEGCIYDGVKCSVNCFEKYVPLLHPLPKICGNNLELNLTFVTKSGTAMPH